VRAIFTGVFLLFGSQLIYYGMLYNGAGRHLPALWGFIKWIHDCLVFGLIVAAILGGIWVLLFLISEIVHFGQKQKPEEPKVYMKTQADLEYEEALRIERQLEEETRAKKIEEQRQFEEKQKQEILLARQRRSADEATRSAMEDFL
jgi:hypothetical protein